MPSILYPVLAFILWPLIAVHAAEDSSLDQDQDRIAAEMFAGTSVKIPFRIDNALDLRQVKLVGMSAVHNQGDGANRGRSGKFLADLEVLDDRTASLILTASNSVGVGQYEGSIRIVDAESSAQQRVLDIKVTRPTRSDIPSDVSMPSGDRIIVDDHGTPLVRDELIVSLRSKERNPRKALREITISTNGTVIGSIEKANIYQIKYDTRTAEEIKAKRKEVSRLGAARSVSLSYIQADPNDQQTSSAKIPATESADIDGDGFPDVNWWKYGGGRLSWGFRTVKMPDAWSVTTKSDAPIAVVDTGFHANHEDLADILKVRDGVALSREPSHGTEVSGIVAAAGTNELGMAGAIWDADNLSGYKVTPLGRSALQLATPRVHRSILAGDGANQFKATTAISIASAMHRAAEGGARIINGSLVAYGQPECSAIVENPEREEAIVNEINGFMANVIEGAGPDVLWIFSAGNAGVDASYQSPASLAGKFDNVIAVGAVDEDTTISECSNRGDLVEIYAPGAANQDPLKEGIYTTTNGCSKTETDGRACNYTWHENDPGETSAKGTSLAAPFVTGVAGLLLGRHADLDGEELKNCILEAATIKKARRGRFPLLNAGKALKAAENGKCRVKDRNQNVSQEIHTADCGPTRGVVHQFRGEDSFNSWTGTLNFPTPTRSHNWASVNSPKSLVPYGNASMKVEIKSGDPQWETDIGHGPKRRAEFSWRKWRFEGNKEGWAGGAFYLPSNPMASNRGTAIFQLLNDPDQGVMWNLYTWDGRLRSTNEPLGDLIDIDLSPYLDRWTRMTVNFKPSTGDDGFIKMWLNDKLVLDMKGRTKPSGSNGPYFKHGTYFWGYERHDSNKHAVAYYDNLRIGDEASNYASVNPACW